MQWGFSGGMSGKESACQCRRYKRCRFNPWVRKGPWRRKWHPSPVFSPGECHRQSSLAATFLPGGSQKVRHDWAHTHTHTHTRTHTHTVCISPSDQTLQMQLDYKEQRSMKSPVISDLLGKWNGYTYCKKKSLYLGKARCKTKTLKYIILKRQKWVDNAIYL